MDVCPEGWGRKGKKDLRKLAAGLEEERKEQEEVDSGEEDRGDEN